MKKLLLVPLLLLAACGDNLQPDEDQAVAGAGGSGATGDTSGATLFAFFISSPGSCADHTENLEGHWGYTDGRPLPNNIECRYDFGDGTSEDTCFATHSFPAAQVVTFTVTDLDTGATASSSEAVIGPRSLDATLDVTTSGLSISWEAHGYYDGVIGTDIQLSFDPADKVIIEDPSILRQTTGTVRVTEAGTYTVEVATGVSFGEEGGCRFAISRTVEVICNDGH